MLMVLINGNDTDDDNANGSDYNDEDVNSVDGYW